MEEQDIYQEAKKRVKAKKGFVYHFLAYVLVLVLLYAIMYFENNGDFLPVIIVALGWGIGIATHYFKTFGTQNLDVLGVNPDWEERELEQEIAKLRRKRELKEQIREEKGLLDDLERLELKEIEKRRLDNDDQL